MSHPIYSCLVEGSGDAIACYDTHGIEGKPGFAICALHPVKGHTVSSVVLDVEDSQGLSDQLVSFLVGQMPKDDKELELACIVEPDDMLTVCEYLGKDRGQESLVISVGLIDSVHLAREGVTALRDRLNQFLEATK